MRKLLFTLLLSVFVPATASSPCKYEAKVISVYDGDTITVDIYLGLGIWVKDKKIRLLGINTPEIKTKDEDEKQRGYLTRDTLRSLILNKEILLETDNDKTGKFGRLLGTVYLQVNKDSLLNVNQWLVDNGFAEEKTY